MNCSEMSNTGMSKVEVLVLTASVYGVEKQDSSHALQLFPVPKAFLLMWKLNEHLWDKTPPRK
jgi:hypothetical protein